MDTQISRPFNRLRLSMLRSITGIPDQELRRGKVLVLSQDAGACFGFFFFFFFFFSNKNPPRKDQAKEPDGGGVWGFL